MTARWRNDISSAILLGVILVEMEVDGKWKGEVRFKSLYALAKE
jgi:hypothetical protein